MGASISFNNKDQLKYEFARRIAAKLRENDMSQVEASKAFGINESIVSRICNANLTVFTLDRLMGIAMSMGIVVNVNFEDNC